MCPSLMGTYTHPFMLHAQKQERCLPCSQGRNPLAASLPIAAAMLRTFVIPHSENLSDE